MPYSSLCCYHDIQSCCIYCPDTTIVVATLITLVVVMVLWSLVLLRRVHDCWCNCAGLVVLGLLRWPRSLWLLRVQPINRLGGGLLDPGKISHKMTPPSTNKAGILSSPITDTLSKKF